MVDLIREYLNEEGRVYYRRYIELIGACWNFNVSFYFFSLLIYRLVDRLFY